MKQNDIKAALRKAVREMSDEQLAALWRACADGRLGPDAQAGARRGLASLGPGAGEQSRPAQERGKPVSIGRARIKIGGHGADGGPLPLCGWAT
jgi:hypothetical protein